MNRARKGIGSLQAGGLSQRRFEQAKAARPTARTRAEEILVETWAGALSVKCVAANDNFFDLGGDSLLAARIVATLRGRGIDVSIRDLFETQTITGLLSRVSITGGATLSDHRTANGPLPMEAHAPVAEGHGVGALSPIRRRPIEVESLASLDQEARLTFSRRWRPEGVSHGSIIGQAFRLSGPVDRLLLEMSLTEIVRRHEALRTTFHQVRGKWISILAAPSSIALAFTDLRGLEVADRDAAARDMLRAELTRQFDLTVAPLVRATLLQTDKDDYLLAIVTEHIAADGWSLRLIIKEFSVLYSSFVSGLASPLKEPTLQYADFAYWQRQSFEEGVLKESLRYWAQQLQDCGPVPELVLPGAKRISYPRSYEGATARTAIKASLARIQGLSRSHDATVFMTLLAAFYALSGSYSGADTIAVIVPAANRIRIPTESIVGWFNSQLVLRTDVGGDPSFTELLGRTREACLSAYSHQEVPFLTLIQALRPELAGNQWPEFVTFNSLGHQFTELPLLTGVRVEELDLGGGDQKFTPDVHFRFEQAETHLTLSVGYLRDRYDGASIGAVMNDYQTVLQRAIDDPRRRLADLVRA